MKKIILSGLFFSCLLAFGDDPASKPTDDSSGNTSPQVDEKAPAQKIANLLVAIDNSGDKSRAAWDAIDAKIADYQRKFKDSKTAIDYVGELREMELIVARKDADPAIYKAILQKLLNDPVPAIAAMAKDQLASQALMDGLKTRPIELKFTSVDGKNVDLATLRGKVVLIDFWATWCPGCVEEIPDVVATYKKYHDQGFEVVGISLDQDKDALLAFTKQNGMAWPQYFDGQGWDNKISNSFGVHEIPAMWLLDQKGMLVATEGGDDLAGQVDKLLHAEKDKAVSDAAPAQ